MLSLKMTHNSRGEDRKKKEKRKWGHTFSLYSGGALFYSLLLTGVERQLTLAIRSKETIGYRSQYMNCILVFPISFTLFGLIIRSQLQLGFHPFSLCNQHPHRVLVQ